MAITLLQAGTLLLLPVIAPASLTPREPCQLERLTYVNADERAIERFVTATHDYVAAGPHGRVFNDEAAQIFRFRLRVSRWLHRYQAVEALDHGPRRPAHAASVAPGVVAAALPDLPDELAYRLAGGHLLLVDLRTKAVVDLLPHAFEERWGR
jgi:hypothetical protein